VVADRKNPHINGKKDPLLFEKYIFRSGKPVRDDDGIIVVAVRSNVAVFQLFLCQQLCPEIHCTVHKIQNIVAIYKMGDTLTMPITFETND
jgi:hypothetical protein